MYSPDENCPDDAHLVFCDIPECSNTLWWIIPLLISFFIDEIGPSLDPLFKEAMTQNYDDILPKSI